MKNQNNQKPKEKQNSNFPTYPQKRLKKHMTTSSESKLILPNSHSKNSTSNKKNIPKKILLPLSSIKQKSKNPETKIQPKQKETNTKIHNLLPSSGDVNKISPEHKIIQPVQLSENKDTQMNNKIKTPEICNTSHISPRSTNCSEIGRTYFAMSNDVFLKKILSLFISLQPNRDNNSSFLNKDFYPQNQLKLEELQNKINSINFSNSIQNIEEIDLNSKKRMQIYTVFFDFIYGILNEIKNISFNEIDKSLFILKQIDEVTNTYDIEDSLLEEKSNMILPFRNSELEIENSNSKLNNSFSKFISSISCEYYQKIINKNSDNYNQNKNNSFELSRSCLNSKIKKRNSRQKNQHFNERNYPTYDENNPNDQKFLDVTPQIFTKKANECGMYKYSKDINDRTIEELEESSCGMKVKVRQIKNENLVKEVYPKKEGQKLAQRINLMHPNQILNQAKREQYKYNEENIQIDDDKSNKCNIF